MTSQTSTNVSVELSASNFRVNKVGDIKFFSSIIIIISNSSSNSSSSSSSSSNSSNSSSNIKVFYSPNNAQVIVLKTILKFTLKQLRHVSVQSHHLQGAHYPCLLKLYFVKIANYCTSVCD